MYALSSILAFDPWHMVTSFVPYIFLSPTYINILNMLVMTYHLYWTNVIIILSYAFSNLDDVNFFFLVRHLPLFDINTKQISWGTKQDSTPSSDLGAVIQDSHSHVDVEMLTEAADVNSIYEESLSNLRDRVPIDNPKGKGLPSVAEREQAAKDYYANVRTNLLLTWVLSNVSHQFFLFYELLNLNVIVG